MTPIENRIATARAAKVEGLLAVLGEVTPEAAARFTPAEREATARAAGVNPPSDTSWAMVVDALRVRTTTPAALPITALTLATGQYARFKPEMGTPVATSVGKPRWKKGTYELCNPLAPYGIFNRKPQPDYDEFLGLYLARLDEGRLAIERGLGTIGAMNPDRPLVILCWCRVDGAEDNWCHRTMFRLWAARTWRMDVPELCGQPHPGHLDPTWRHPGPQPGMFS